MITAYGEITAENIRKVVEETKERRKRNRLQEIEKAIIGAAEMTLNSCGVQLMESDKKEEIIKYFEGNGFKIRIERINREAFYKIEW